jgi:phosphoribosyl-AMP cyclohydrolase
VDSKSLIKHFLARWRSKSSGFFVFAAALRGIFLKGVIVEIAFDKSGGLVPAIIQDETSGDVLMLGFMNAESVELTRRTGEVVFFSRSRNKLWKKGASSGHVLKVCDIRIDCDADSLLIRVNPVGPGVCHEGYRSCFFRTLNNEGAARIIAERTFAPESVYASPSSLSTKEGK